MRKTLIVNTTSDVATWNYFDFFIATHPFELRIDFNQIITRYMDYVALLACEVVVSSMQMFENNYRPLLIVLHEFIDKYMANKENCVALVSLNIIDSILRLLWDLTDKIPLIPIFVNIGCVEKTFQWISTGVFVSHIAVLGPSIFSMIYNLSRNNKGLEKIQTKQPFEILIKYKQMVVHENCTELAKIFGITLISLATSNQLNENKEFFFGIGETLYDGCRKAGQTIDLRDNGIHLSESLNLLYRVFFNSTCIMKHILDCKTNENPTPIEYFITRLSSFYGTLLDPEPSELEKCVAKYSLKILREISRDPNYKEQLTQNNELWVIIECLASRPKQYVAEAIRLQIQPESSAKELISSSIYVSYDWNDQGFCRQFVKYLSVKISKPIWVNDENVELDEDAWEHSLALIDSAAIIIVLVSTAYAENNLKVEELSYITSACNKSKDMEKSLIIVEAEPEFSFNQHRMSDLIHNETRIPYENNISKMASKVCKLIIPKKSPFKCLPCQNRNFRKTTAEHDNFSSNSKTNTSYLPSIRVPVQKESVDTTGTSNVLISTARCDSYSVVTRLLPQTGSTNSSTWV